MNVKHMKYNIESVGRPTVVASSILYYYTRITIVIVVYNIYVINILMKTLSAAEGI